MAGAFGARSAKPLQVLHVAPEFSQLKRQRLQRSDVQLSYTVQDQGTRKVYGKKGVMKSSEAYTPEFAAQRQS